MKSKILTWGTILLVVTLFGGRVQAAPPPIVDVSYHGNLVAVPCALLPGDENRMLNFGTVIDKHLYLNDRTNSQPFELHLIDCDTSLGSTVKVTFSGIESAALPGLLSIDTNSDARGIAIGLETKNGQALLLNQQSNGHALNNGSTTLILQAYVQGEPQAIKDKTIGRGAFTAVATFVLEYE